PRQLRHRETDRLVARAPVARLRAFQSLHPCRQRNRMRELPWTNRHDAADVSGFAADDGVVPDLPPWAGEVRPPAQRGFQYGLHREGPGEHRPEAGAGVQHSEVDELLDMSLLVLALSS